MKKNFLQKTLLNLKDSNFFNSRFPSSIFSSIVCSIHFIQLLTLTWINTNMILLQIPEVQREILNMAITYFTLIEDSSSSITERHSIWKVIVAFLVVLTFGFILGLTYVKVVKKSKIPVWVTSTLNYIGYSTILVLGLPTFTVLLRLFIESTEKFSSERIFILWIVLSVIFIAFFTIQIFGFLKLLIPLKTKNFFARFDNLYFGIALSHKFFLSIIIIVILKSDDVPSLKSSWLICLINLVFGFASLAAITLKCSFMKHETISLLVVLQSSVVAAVFSNFISLVKVYFYKITPNSTIFQTLILFVLILKITKNRIDSLKSQDLKSIDLNSKDETWLYLNMSNGIKDYSTAYQGLIFSESLKDYFKNLKYSVNFDQKAFLQKVCKSNSDRAKLMCAFLYITEFRDIYNAYILSNGLFKNSFSTLGTKVGAMYIQNIIENVLDEASLAKKDNRIMEIYFAYNQKFEFLKKLITEFLDDNIIFYKLLKEKSPDLHAISKKSLSMQKKFREVQLFWNQSIQAAYDKIPPRLLHLYALLFSGLKIKPQESRLIRNLANVAMFERVSKEKSGLNSWLNRDETVYVISSIQLNSKEKILSISNSVAEVAGFSTSEMIGKNLNLLFPKILAELFSELFKDHIYSEKNFRDVLALTSFILHKNGYLIPCETRSKIFFHPENGLCLGTVISLLEDTKDVALLDHQGKITGVTRKLKSIVELGVVFDAENPKNLEEKWNQKVMGIPKSKKFEGGNSAMSSDSQRKEKIIEADETYKIFPGIMKYGKYEIKALTIEIVNRNLFFSQNFNFVRNEESVDLLTISDEVEEDEEEINSYDKKNNLDAVSGISRTVKIPQKSPLKNHNTQTYKNSKGYSSSKNSQKKKKELQEQNVTKKIVKLRGADNGIDGQSVLTGNSDYSLRRLDILFDILQKKLKFYKFKHSHFLFVTYVVFLGFFAISILVSYLNGKNAVSEVKDRIKLIVAFSARNRALLDLGRFVWFDQLMADYFSFVYPLDMILLFRASVIPSAKNGVDRLSSINKDIKGILNLLTDKELKNYMFEENIRVFYGDYDNLPTTDMYYMADNLKACDDLISSIKKYTNILLSGQSYQREKMYMIYANIYNDLQIHAEGVEAILQNSITNTLNSINSTTKTIYIITFASLAIYCLSVIYVMVIYFVDTVIFFTLFANHPTEDLQNRVKNLERFRNIISSDIKRDTDLTCLDDNVYIAQAKISLKNIKSSSFMFSIFLRRLLNYLILLIPPIIVLGLSYKYSFDYTSVVNREVNNILKISYITNKAYIVYNEVALTDILQGKAYVKGVNSRTIINDEIEIMGNSISASQKFDSTLESMLSENLCLYYNKTQIDTECNQMINGIAEQGIRAFIYDSYGRYKVERVTLNNVTYNFFVVLSMVTRDYRANLYYLIADALVPATNIFIDEISSGLLLYLDEQLSSIIGQFIASIVIDIICLASMIYLVYGKLIEERKQFINTINFVPLDFILVNIHFRMYMIRESKDFVNFFKHSEFLKKKFINNKKA